MREIYLDKLLKWVYFEIATRLEHEGIKSE